ncbi:unnamed protein product [Eruca vesicaria subsp. sativa]|uniref:RRM domain-containing protein n=1 Tax=Eruca vesicaria subsp. sativa TaxID=29727 RepID=A0ABC8KSS6_ERUVS|nr:unnamed protein product [Eruca vesicaria subsp. sativa]
MAMGRLLTPKLNPHFSCRGVLPLKRRWSSSSSSSLEDGRNLERLPDPKASANKDIGQKGRWYSLGGLLTNLKKTIMGNMPSLLNKPPADVSVLSKSPMGSSRDVTVEKVISLEKNVADNKNCIPPSAKEESLVSEDSSQSVAGADISRKRETTSVEKEMLDSNNSLEGLEFAQEKVLSLLQAEKVDIPEEASENQVQLQPEKGDNKVLPENNLSNMFINLHPDKEVKPSLRFEALSNTTSRLSTREFSRDEGGQHVPVQKMKSITTENDQQSGELTAIRERKTTYPFGSSKGTVAPVAESKDSSIKKLLESLKVPTNNVTEADDTWSNGEGQCVWKGCSLTEEEESKGLCSQAATLADATSVNQESTRKSLDALSIREHSPNKVMLRFLHEGFQKSGIVESFSNIGAVLDVQEVPSFEGCIYKDALVTFETESAVKKALKKGVVMVKHHSAMVEALSQKNMVEKIRIPDLIGDPDVPISLVKEPTRTVKIHPLDQNISSKQIREALGFCKSDISKIIFGSSTTAAFVEFKTEVGKEKALAAHSVDVQNKQLFISRIDIPRTTVARISNLSGSTGRDVRELCATYGHIKHMFFRGNAIADVRFDVSEWPNMLTILNSMNGKEINGKKWVVRPATTVIPHEILKVLWEDPHGKSYVKGLIKTMVREIEQPLYLAGISSLYSALED